MMKRLVWFLGGAAAGIAGAGVAKKKVKAAAAEPSMLEASRPYRPNSVLPVRTRDGDNAVHRSAASAASCPAVGLMRVGGAWPRCGRVPA